MTGTPKLTAVIVGASGGVGRAVARALAATHDLWLVGRNPTSLSETAGYIPSAKTWVIDLEDLPAPITPPAAITQVDALVLAAGSWVGGSIAGTDIADWATAMQVNALGQVAIARSLLPQLRKSRGKLIGLSSTAVLGAPGGRGAYTASKAAFEVFLTALHEEERHQGVQVSIIQPGRIDTPILDKLHTASKEGAPKVESMSPDDIAGVISQLVTTSLDVQVMSMVVRAKSFTATGNGDPD
jgi:NADP-dependent 3-hydroxy acid dehydrogenase YdfG